MYLAASSPRGHNGLNDDFRFGSNLQIRAGSRNNRETFPERLWRIAFIFTHVLKIERSYSYPRANRPSRGCRKSIVYTI